MMTSGGDKSILLKERGLYFTKKSIARNKVTKIDSQEKLGAKYVYGSGKGGKELINIR
jgi:hypothetical protein